MDYAGGVEYSGIETVSTESDNTLEIVVFPNPVNIGVELKIFRTAYNKIAVIYIYTLSGRIMS